MSAERLKEALYFLKENGVEAAGNYQKVAKSMGYNPNYISDIVNGRFAISAKFAERFQEVFAINREWLLTGNGDMTREGMVYPSNRRKPLYASDLSFAEKYLKSEETNAKLLKEYSDIIQTLQSRVSDLMEQQIRMVQENAELKRRIGEIKKIKE